MFASVFSIDEICANIYSKWIHFFSLCVDNGLALALALSVLCTHTHAHVLRVCINWCLSQCTSDSNNTNVYFHSIHEWTFNFCLSPIFPVCLQIYDCCWCVLSLLNECLSFCFCFDMMCCDIHNFIIYYSSYYLLHVKRRNKHTAICLLHIISVHIRIISINLWISSLHSMKFVLIIIYVQNA